MILLIFCIKSANPSPNVLFFGRENPRELAQRCGNRDIWGGIGVDQSGDFQIEASFGLNTAEIRELCRVLGVAGLERQIYNTLLPAWQCRKLYNKTLYSMQDAMTFMVEESTLDRRTFSE